MEILLFDLGPEECAPLPASDHPHVRLIRLGPTDLLSSARVRGIRMAQAPVIGFMEEHCEMPPGWAEKILAHYDKSWAAVGSDFVNANPDAGLSNKAFRMNYGIYVRPSRLPTVPLMASQTFKRDVLLRYEPELELLLNADLVLQRKMQQDGYELFYEPEVKMAHRNENTFRSMAVGAFYWNWCFANVRAQVSGWRPIRRSIWIVLAPSIPWIRLFRLCIRLLRGGYLSPIQFLGDVPFILAISHIAVAGQVAGLLCGIERGAREFSNFEMNEPRLLRADPLS
ncbi:MAG: glycosyltransferase [Chthoniobacterales bacterium]